MDGQRFDAVTRLVGAGSSRRSVLAALASGTVFGVVRSRHALATTTCVPLQGSCDSADECCDENAACDEIFGTCCLPAGSQCGSGDDCCPDVSCYSGFCALYCAGEGQPCATSQDGASAAEFVPCCHEDLTCNVDGVCVPFCQTYGEACTGDEDCCGSLGLVCHENGFCSGSRACSTLGQSCNMSGPSECCEGLICNDGDCEDPTCGDRDAACDVDDDCCIGICCNTGCQDVECCAFGPDPDARCPEGTACVEGTCEKVGGTHAATIVVHLATCSTGTGDLFGDCHDNGFSDVTFTITSAGEVSAADSGTVTTDDDGVVAASVGIGAVTVTEDPGVADDYLGSYVYCSEQNSGKVLFDGSADSASVGFALEEGDEVICDWYNITEADEDDDDDDGGTTLPSTGAGSTTGGSSPWLSAATIGAAAALVASKRLREAAAPEVPEE